MAYQFYNPNPYKKAVGDCVIRALCKALESDWYDIYSQVVVQGYALCDMPSSNAVWGQFLKDNGYKRYIVPNTCPDCYTIRDFVNDNPTGTFILCTGSHVVTATDGTYFDSWDSGDETPIFYWRKDETNAKHKLSAVPDVVCAVPVPGDADAGSAGTTEQSQCTTHTE